MNQFMILVRNQGTPMAGLSEAELNEHMGKWGSWMEGLKNEGKLEGGLPLSMESAAVVSGNGVSAGLHKEANDVSVGGYLFINAENLDEAIAISKGCPALENATSSVEVRECVSM